jgi:putative sigma-54 modulation protein
MESAVPAATSRENKERRLTMEVEFTARQVKVPKALRTRAEEGLQRIAQIMGKTAHASIIFAEQRHLQIVELTVQARSQKIVAEGKAATQTMALKEAIEHAENQAVRFRDRNLTRKRLPIEEKVASIPPVSRTKARAGQPKEEFVEPKPARTKARNAIAVQSNTARTTVVEPHVIKSTEAIAGKPMTIEEAVKDAESRDRELLVFRNPAGDLYLLHRRRDGEMELLELP